MDINYLIRDYTNELDDLLNSSTKCVNGLYWGFYVKQTPKDRMVIPIQSNLHKALVLS